LLGILTPWKYGGFSLGALLGSIVISALSVQWIGAAGALCAVIAAGLSTIGWRQQSRAG
jgi:predicted MFS family arabinose efflux permease